MDDDSGVAVYVILFQTTKKFKRQDPLTPYPRETLLAV